MTDCLRDRLPATFPRAPKASPDSLSILVCVRQVPHRASRVILARDGIGIDDTGFVYQMNEYDAYALEEAVRWKERYGDVHITALSVGPERVRSVIRRALEFGADHGVHIQTDGDDPLDAFGTGSLIAAYAARKTFSLMLFGVMSEDLQRCQTGPMTAALLGLVHATCVISAKRSEDASSILVEREVEGGDREVLKLPLPAVVAVQPGINCPRYPSLSNKLRALRQDLEIVPSESLVQIESRIRRIAIRPPTATQPGAILQGTLEEKAEELVRIIHERTGLI